MSIPVYRRFARTEFPDVPYWMDEVFNPLNVFCETTVNSINKNLEIGSNVQGMKFTFSFKTASDYTTGTFTPINFNYTGNGIPNCVLIGNIKCAGQRQLQPVSITEWLLNNNRQPSQIVINYIAGLYNSESYTVTFLIL